MSKQKTIYSLCVHAIIAGVGVDEHVFSFESQSDENAKKFVEKTLLEDENILGVLKERLKDFGESAQLVIIVSNTTEEVDICYRWNKEMLYELA